MMEASSPFAAAAAAQQQIDLLQQLV